MHYVLYHDHNIVGRHFTVNDPLTVGATVKVGEQYWRVDKIGAEFNGMRCTEVEPAISPKVAGAIEQLDLDGDAREVAATQEVINGIHAALPDPLPGTPPERAEALSNWERIKRDARSRFTVVGGAKHDDAQTEAAREFGLKDSGERRQFATGSQRDRGDLKPRPDLISPFALMRIGELMRKGAVKYDLRNWELGQPYSEVTASMTRHLLQWIQGETDEDHLAAVVFGACALMHYQEMIRRGVLPAELDDMPRYGKGE